MSKVELPINSSEASSSADSTSDGSKKNVTILGMHPVGFGLTIVLAGITVLMGMIIAKNIK